MSRTSLIIIGVVAGVLGMMVFMVGLQPKVEGMADPKVFLLISAVAFCISIACIVPKSRPITMRLIGGVLAVGTFVLLLVAKPEESRDLKVQRNPYAMYVFGTAVVAAGGWLAVTGKYPDWAPYAAQFAMIEQENARKKTKKVVRKVKRKRPINDDFA